MKPPSTHRTAARSGKNIFFDVSRLKGCGENVVIGKSVRIRYPELVEIGDDCIIDDFTHISTALRLSSRIHISAGCKLIGGQSGNVVIGEYSTLAPGVVLAAGSDDYIGGIATPMEGSHKYQGALVEPSNIGGVGLHKGIDLTSDVSLAADGLEFGLAAGDLALSKRLRALVGAEPANRDHEEGSVGLTVAATVEAVAISLAGGGGQRRHPAEHRPGGCGPDAPGGGRRR